MGDLIWHLPLIRAIAARSPDRRVTLITKPSTQAEALLEGDPSVERLVWFDHNRRDGQGSHDGPLGMVRLSATLRRCRLDTCVLLHHSTGLAASMALAGIVNRLGYGYGVQRRWLTRPPFMPTPPPFTEAAEQAAAYALALKVGPLPEPSVVVRPSWAIATQARLAGLPTPLSVLGVGCHGTERQWRVERFAQLAAELRELGWTVLIAAAAHEAALANYVRRMAGGDVRCAIGWSLPEMAACLAQADLFIGTDSGLMNLRAAVGRPAYGLFGASGPLHHSSNIRAIIPPGGARAGMEALHVEQVLEAVVARSLASTVAPTTGRHCRSSPAGMPWSLVSQTDHPGTVALGHSPKTPFDPTPA